MPLIKDVLKQQIKKAQENASKSQSIDAANDIFAEELSTAIDAYIKSGDVTTAVVTTGTSAAQTGTGQGKIT